MCAIYEDIFATKNMDSQEKALGRNPHSYRDDGEVLADGDLKPLGPDIYKSSWELVNYIGWKYDHKQPQALQRGSAKVSFKDMVVEMEEDPEVKKQIRSGRVSDDGDWYPDDPETQEGDEPKEKSGDEPKPKSGDEP
jgi:hypothetical protein